MRRESRVDEVTNYFEMASILFEIGCVVGLDLVKEYGGTFFRGSRRVPICGMWAMCVDVG
jgi:hypothetical protein